MRIFLLAVLLLTGNSGLAEGSSRFQGHFGIGQGTTVSADGRTTFIENPMAFGFTVDHEWNFARRQRYFFVG